MTQSNPKPVEGALERTIAEWERIEIDANAGGTIAIPAKWIRAALDGTTMRECAKEVRAALSAAPASVSNEAVELLRRGILAMTGQCRIGWADDVRAFLSKIDKPSTLSALPNVGYLKREVAAAPAPRMFPIQKATPIPWSLAERAYRTYAEHYGRQQSLERLAERGGFGWSEFLHLYYGDTTYAKNEEMQARWDADELAQTKLRIAELERCAAKEQADGQ